MRNLRFGSLPFVVLLAGLLHSAEHTVWVVDDTCKVNPLSGNVLEEHYFRDDPGKKKNRAVIYSAKDSYQSEPRKGTYRSKNWVWDAKQNAISIRSASNMFVQFQVIVEKGDSELKGVTLSTTDLSGHGTISKENAAFFTERYMKLDKRGFWYPDALIPHAVSKKWATVDIPDNRHGIAGQICQGFWVDYYIPHKTKPGKYRGKVEVSANGGSFKRTLNLQVEVLNIELPDEMSYMPELNTYFGVASMMGMRGNEPEYREAELRFHQLCHKHRTTLNIYFGEPSNPKDNQRGVVKPGGAPGLAGGIRGTGGIKLDWANYDKRQGPYFDGTAFKDMPRKGVPVTHAYLPMAMSWPTHIAHYFKNKGAYEKRWVETFKQVAAHIEEKKWDKVQFQVFLNDKRRAQAPWNLDEPIHAADYKAHQMYGGWINQVLGKWKERKQKNIVYRVDIGTYSTTKKWLDGFANLRVVNYDVNVTTFWKSNEIQRTRAFGDQWWCYAQDADNQRLMEIPWSMPSTIMWGWAPFYLDAPGYCKFECTYVNRKNPFGSAGFSEGRQRTYTQLFYPGDTSRFSGPAAKKDDLGYNGPIPSMRLKGLRRGSQDYELMAMLTKRSGGDRAPAMAILKKYYDLKGNYRGVVGRTRVTAEHAAKLRNELLNAVAGMK